MLQRLAALPKENVEVGKEYAGDPGAIALVSGYIGQENALLARQAAEVAQSLPKDAVSSTEYYGIGLALGAASDLQNEKSFLKLAEETTQDSILRFRYCGLWRVWTSLWVNPMPVALSTKGRSTSFPSIKVMILSQ